MQRFAVYLRTTQCRGYPPLPHIMVDSEPPFGAGRFAMRASTLALALIRIHLFPPKRNHNIDTKNIGIMAFLLQNKGDLPFFIDFLAKM